MEDIFSILSDIKRFGININIDDYNRCKEIACNDELMYQSIFLRSKYISAKLNHSKIKILEIGAGYNYEPVIKFIICLLEQRENKKNISFDYTAIDSEYRCPSTIEEDKNKIVNILNSFTESKIIDIKSINIIVGDASNDEILSNKMICEPDIIFMNEFPCGEKGCPKGAWYDYKRQINKVWDRLNKTDSTAIFAIFSREIHEFIYSFYWLCKENSDIYLCDLKNRTLILRPNSLKKDSLNSLTTDFPPIYLTPFIEDKGGKVLMKCDCVEKLFKYIKKGSVARKSKTF